MSWWDDFVGNLGDTVMKFLGTTSAGDAPEVTGSLAQSLAYQQFGYKGKFGRATAEEIGRLSRKSSIKLQAAQANVFMTPGREFRNVIQTPFQAVASGTNLGEAYSLVRGDRSKAAWYEPGKEGISFAQSVYGGLAAITPGEQEIDKIDWTDNKEVRDFFDDGPAKWITGGIDAVATIGLDPLIIAGVLGQRARIKYGVAPIRNAKDVERAVAEIDVAVQGGKSDWTDFIDYIFANKDDESAIAARSNIFESAKSGDLASTFAAAARKGNRELVGDLTKVAVGDKNALDKLIARKDMVSAQAAFIKLQERKVRATALASGDREYYQQYIDTISEQIGKAAQEETILLSAVGRIDPLTGQVGSSLFGSMMNRTVSRFSKVEFWRNKTATSRAKTMFDEEYLTVEGLPVRVLTWLNPAGPIKEAPSGMFNLGNFGANEAWRETLAQARALSRITGKDYKNIVNQYLRFPTKEQRYDYLINLEKTMVRDIIEARVIKPRFVENMDDAQRMQFSQQVDAVETLVDALMTAKPRIQSRVYANIKKNNYVIFDEDFGNPVVVKQLESSLRKMAEMENTTYEKIIDALASEPAFGSQAANVYHFMDVQAYDDVIRENISTIRNMLDIIDDTLYAGKGKEQLSNSEIKKDIRAIITDIASDPRGSLTKQERYLSQGKEFYDMAVRVADVYHASVWKPLTLISLKYTTRNIMDVYTRTLPALYQMSVEAGDSTFKAVGDFVGNPVKSISRVVENGKSRLGARQARERARQLSPAQRAFALREESLLTQSTKTMETAFSSLRFMAERISTIKDPKGNLKAQLDNWMAEPSKNQIISKLKNSEVRRFVTLLVDGDVDTALTLMNQTKDVSTLTFGLSELKDDILRIAQSFDEPIANNTYANYLAKRDVDMIVKYQASLVDTAEAIDRVIATRVNAAAAWQDFDKLIVGTNPILKQKDDGTFQVMPGVHMPDWGMGPLGTYAKKESAADTTYFNTVQAGNRLIGESVITRFTENKRINPGEKNWAQAYVRFVNEDVRSDALLYRILDGTNNPQLATDEALLSLLKTREFKGYRTVLGLEKKSDEYLLEHINSRRLMVELYVPEIPGMAPGWLKSKVAKDGLDELDIEKIPQMLRAPVSGQEVTQGVAKHLFYYWNKAIGNIFKYIGSLPETVLARHPFYRASYRMNVRRMARVLDGQGADITSPKYQSLIQRVSHERAYKELNQTLYTVMRRTEFAQAMRFIQPFYMANQNASRFWMGASFKNPALPQLGFLLWNTPNQVLDVRDSQGNPIDEPTLPFFSDEIIYITLPENIANFIGQDKMYFYKTSFDLVTNGALPIVPQASGPLASLPIGALLRETDIVNYAVDNGFDGDFIERFVTPYFDPYASATDILTPRPAWLRAFSNFQGNTPQFASRVSLIHDQMMMEADLAGVELTDKQMAESIKEAAEIARKTYFTEMVFSIGIPPNIAAAKFTVNQDLLKKEYRRYITRYGNVDGAIKFEQDFGKIKTVYARSSLSENPGGLLATPQTLRNLKNNMGLAEEIASSTRLGEEGFSVLGLLFNDGEPEDYSTLVNSQFYDIKIAGRPIKQQNEDLAAAQRKNEVNVGWSMYIPYKNILLSIAETQGVKQNSTEWNARFKPLLDKKVAEVSALYPAWADARLSFNGAKATNVFYALAKAVNNKSYMQGAGKRNQVAKAMKEWVPFRNIVASILARRQYKTIDAQANQDIFETVERKAAELSAKYPEFTLVYDRFLANDSFRIEG